MPILEQTVENQMKHRIGMALICLHISAALYIAIGIAFYALFISLSDPDLESGAGFAVTIFCWSLAAGVEFVAWGLRQRKYWAWIAGLIVFGMYIPSAFMPLGAFGLWGLLDRRSRSEFGVETNERDI